MLTNTGQGHVFQQDIRRDRTLALDSELFLCKMGPHYHIQVRDALNERSPNGWIALQEVLTLPIWIYFYEGI